MAKVFTNQMTKRYDVVARLSLLVGLLCRGVVVKACQVNFLLPIGEATALHHLDTINVAYNSDLSSTAAISCWCGNSESALQVYSSGSITSSGTIVVPLTFESSGPCWLQFSSDDNKCIVNSTTFNVDSSERPAGVSSNIDLRSLPTRMKPRAESSAAAESTSSPSTSSTPATNGNDGTAGDNEDDNDSLTTGAKAGIGIAVAGIGIATGAIAACLFLRHKRKKEGSRGGSLMHHKNRHGRRAEKGYSGRGSSRNSNGSVDALDDSVPFEAVPDGFPGSTGYDDVRSIESGSYMHSPVSQPHSPVFPPAYPPSVATTDQHLGGHHSYPVAGSVAGSVGGAVLGRPLSGPGYYTTGQDNKSELNAARMKSQPVTNGVVSYGPNPITPIKSPRQQEMPLRYAPSLCVSIDSQEDIPASTPLRTSYHYRPPAVSAPAQPTVISYGPNRVTPTPPITHVTVPPQSPEAISKLQRQQQAFQPTFNEYDPYNPSAWNPGRVHARSFSFDAHDDAFALGDVGLNPKEDTKLPMVPLPPYASTADFYAMEKGAIRKLAEPAAQAELPPTKDGFYHFGTIENEYELQGGAPQNEPQLPHRMHRHGAHIGGEIDEQKFLLSDEEISKLRELKKKQRAQLEQQAGSSASQHYQEQGS